MNTDVKYIAGILTQREDLRDEVICLLANRFGRCDFIGNWHAFDHTNYYEEEMGKNLKRSFVSFEKLLGAETLSEAKIWCAEVEDKFRENGRRLVNLDPGYVDHFKVVLASGKPGGHRLAISRSCWADFLMMYSKGGWVPMPWCYPDLASRVYDKELLKIRQIFKTAKRTSRRHPAGFPPALDSRLPAGRQGLRGNDKKEG